MLACTHVVTEASGPSRQAFERSGQTMIQAGRVARDCLHLAMKMRSNNDAEKTMQRQSNDLNFHVIHAGHVA